LTLGKEVKIFFSGKEGEEKKNFAEWPDLGHSARKENLFFWKEGEEKNEKKTLPSAQIWDTRQRTKST